jgi:two-component system, sensor histidine kinase and response regulator
VSTSVLSARRMTGSPTSTPISLLIVDDEKAHVAALCDALEQEGYATAGFDSPTSALAALRRRSFDLVLTDLMMPQIDGITLLRTAREIDADLVGIVMTGYATIDTAVKAMQAGAYDYIVKPVRLNGLLPVIARGLETRRLRCLNKELERRIRERTREVEASNRDLEAFSYSVSHDLRAPLRAIHGYCSRVLTDFSGELPEQARPLLQSALSGADDLGQLIEALLGFARCGREPLALRRVSMRALVEEVLTDLRRQNPERSVELTVEELADCSADPRLLKQVVVNILSNAYKFTADREAARIRIGSEAREGMNAYFVEDNGAGFDMNYASKLFGVFQRLHSQRDFKGSGVGLSIVRRIIERHGGEVWAEGRPGEGATFHFSVPIHA